MNSLLTKFKTYFFDEKYSFKHRMVNAMLLSFVIADLPNIIFTSLIENEPIGIILNVIMYIVVFIFLWIFNEKTESKAAMIVFVLFCNIVIFPLMFFTNGGVSSGMPFWVMVGLIFSGLLLDGISVIVCFCISCIAFYISLKVSIYYPQLVNTLPNRNAELADIVQSVILCSFIIGAIYQVQNHIYNLERKKVKEHEDALNEAIAREEAANKAKSDFLAHMSHEIRTPINAILGMDEMILRKTDNKAISGYAYNIDRAGNTLMSLINDILDFSKIESGKMEIIPGEYETFNLLNDSFNLVYMRAHDKGLTVNIENNMDLPSKLFGDEVRIRQIILNLLTNAIKYTEKGTVTLRADYRQRSYEEISLIISVTDTGIGIAEDNIDKLFDSFTRFDQSENKSIEGTGLGLSITKQLVELMGGTIKVESTLGLGSIFTVEIPQKVVSRELMGVFSEKYAKTVNKNKIIQKTFTANDVRILAVDDVQMNLDVLEALLKNTQVKLDMVLSGKECLEALEKNVYDIVLMDHMMPGMDGIEAFHKMRAMKGNPNCDIPCIVLTANAIYGAQEDYMKAGFTDYLAKPIKSGELDEMLIKYLPKQKITVLKMDNSKESDAPFAGKTLVFEPPKDPGQNPLKIFMDSLTYEQLATMLPMFDINEGIENCAGSKNVYLNSLSKYCKSDYKDELQKLIDKRDWVTYKVRIHALKSESRMIGYDVLADECQLLENAAKSNELSYIQINHPIAMGDYQKAVSLLQSMGKAGLLS